MFSKSCSNKDLTSLTFCFQREQIWSQLPLCQGVGFDIPAHSTPHQVPSPNSSNTLPPALSPFKHVHPIILHDDFSSIKRERKRLHDEVKWLRLCGSYYCSEVVRKMEGGTRIARSCRKLRASFLAPFLRKHGYGVSVIKKRTDKGALQLSTQGLLNAYLKTNLNETLEARDNWQTDYWECTSSGLYTEE